MRQGHCLSGSHRHGGAVKVTNKLGHVGPFDTVALSALARDLSSPVVVCSSAPCTFIFRVLLKYLFLGRVLKSGITCDLL